MKNTRITWCSPDYDRKFTWWYYLVPINAYRGRSGGRASLDICVGFVWTGFVVLHFGGRTMTALSQRLTEIKARAEAATEGPWEAITSEATMNNRSEWRIGDPTKPQVARSVMRGEDAFFIAHARTDVPALVAAVEGVLELHQPVDVEPSDTICGECSHRLPNGRYMPTVEYPCPTVQDITEALGGGQ